MISSEFGGYVPLIAGYKYLPFIAKKGYPSKLGDICKWDNHNQN
jgi:hypothetical protein